MPTPTPIGCMCASVGGSKVPGWLKRQGVLDHDLTGDVACTCVPETDNNGARVCVWLHPEQKTSALVHELVHAAVEILRGSGVPITAQSDEALAYLVERLFIEVQWRWMRPVGSK
jgi:hypothetical protein